MSDSIEYDYTNKITSHKDLGVKKNGKYNTIKKNVKAIDSYIEAHKVHPYMKSPLIMIEKLQLQIKKESI